MPSCCSAGLTSRSSATVSHRHRPCLPPADSGLRPILLTTATTIGGMTPLWLSHDPMFETMAVTIMFGLLFATALTLLFIPVIYTIFFRVRVAR